MKRLLLLGFLALATTSFAQQQDSKKIYKYSPEEYGKLKESGNLPTDGVSMIILDTTKTEKYSRGDGSNAVPTRGGGTCGCYQEPDITYTLAMPPNDDGSTGLITIPFSFCLYGTNYTSLYINNNGNVSFGSPYATFSAVGFPSNAFVMVAPFWGDVDTRNGLGQVVYKILPNAIYINWDDVGYFNIQGDKRNSFQLILSDGTDPIAGLGNNVAFCYKDMQWTTGSASGGIGGFGGTPATVGANKGDGINYVQFGRFDQPLGAYDGPFGANDGIDWLDYQNLKFDVCVTNNNVAPVFSAFQPSGLGGGAGCGDTIRICDIGDTLILSAQAIDPNVGQIVTLTATAPGVAGFSVLSSTPGNPANIVMQFITSNLNVGMNFVNITATDNGIPSSSASLTFWLFVDTTGISNFNPTISGDTVICVGDTTSLHVNTGWNTYLWNTGATTSSIYGLDTAGIYSATVSFNQCFKTIFQEVYEMPAPVPVISGVLNSCNGLVTALSTTSNYLTYSWNNNGNIISTINSANAINGSIILTVVDSFGCQGDTSAIITLNSSTVSISGIAAICQGNIVTLTATASGPGTFQWSNSSTTPTTTVTSTGNYIVTYTDGGGCATSDTFFVTFWPLPNAAFNNSPDTAFNLTTNVQFTDQSTIASPGNIISWVWVFSDTTNYVTQNPSHVFGSYGQFFITLYLTSADGCIDSVTHDFWVVPPIIFPNVFSPGGSTGSNDLLFFPNLFFYGPAQLQVFNRWGTLIYENSDYKNNWDGTTKGKLVSDGTYYYIIKLNNGKTRTMPLTIFIKE